MSTLCRYLNVHFDGLLPFDLPLLIRDEVLIFS